MTVKRMSNATKHAQISSYARRNAGFSSSLYQNTDRFMRAQNKMCTSCYTPCKILSLTNGSFLKFYSYLKCTNKDSLLLIIS